MKIDITLEVADELMPTGDVQSGSYRKCGCGSFEFREVKSMLCMYVLPRDPKTRSETAGDLYRSRQVDVRDKLSGMYSEQASIPMVICDQCNRLLTMQ